MKSEMNLNVKNSSNISITWKRKTTIRI